jgi:hypothetical protein
MSIIQIQIDIDAPLAVCFDVARSVDAHIESARTTGERAVGGVTSGLLNLGDEVTWQGGATRMRDVFDFTAPFGILGSLVDRLILTGYLKRFLESRAEALKRLAESDAVKRFIVQ